MSMILLVILLTVCQYACNFYNASFENLVLDQLENPKTYIFLYMYSHHLSGWYCKEKFCLGHSWELKG